MRKISTKLILLLTSASLVPLITFGMLSLVTSRKAASKLATERNIKIAHRAAEEISQYLDNNIRILKAIASNINRTHLKPWQKEAVLRDYVLQFNEFQTIHLVDAQGKVIVTSSIMPQPDIPKDEAFRKALRTGVPFRSKVFITDELIPTVSLGFPVKEAGRYSGMILGVVNLLDIWRVVDQIKIGQHGYALIISETRQLLAHGDPKLKPLVIEQEVLRSHPLVEEVFKGSNISGIYQNNQGLSVLSVGVPIPDMNWALLIEQPLEEAFIDARTITRRLGIFVVIFTILACGVGLVGGRRYVIEPINRLIEITRAYARGALDRRVQISQKDEFGELGEAFNTMASDLETLKEDIQRKEREAILGRIASGLVHDLKHPIKNIENMTSLIDRLFEDEEFRITFKATIRRELTTINRYFDDLTSVATTKPLQCVPLNLAERLSELCDQVQMVAESQGVEVIQDFSKELHLILADAHALDRIFGNLYSNALDAMPNGGRLQVTTKILSKKAEEKPGRIVEVLIKDTGVGISPEILERIFEAFVSTKQKGLGLGLSIAKKLTEAQGGTIDIQSTVGIGTACCVTFPLLAD